MNLRDAQRQRLDSRARNFANGQSCGWQRTGYKERRCWQGGRMWALREERNGLSIYAVSGPDDAAGTYLRRASSPKAAMAWIQDHGATVAQH